MADTHTHAAQSAVDRPHVGWWVAVLGGMALLAVLAFHAGAYATWCEWVTTALPQNMLRRIFVIAVGLHVGEATYAVRLARRAGLGESAGGWFAQTLMLGFPSLRLLRRRVKAV